MRKQTFNRRKKILSILLLLSIMMSVTTALASAKNISNPHSDYKTGSKDDAKNGYKVGYGTRDYKIGSQAGAQEGYKLGYKAGNEDCLKHGQIGVLTKIPAPDIKDKWTNNYKTGYNEGFKKGYTAGYNNSRYRCLQKK